MENPITSKINPSMPSPQFVEPTHANSILLSRTFGVRTAMEKLWEKISRTKAELLLQDGEDKMDSVDSNDHFSSTDLYYF